MRIIVAAIVIALALIGRQALAAEPTLTITGSGSASAPPDIATLSTGVETRADTAKAALAANSEAMASVIETLKAAGVAEKDIQTSGLSVQPVYEDSKLRSYAGGTEIDHYVATNGVTVVVRDLAGLGSVVDALVGSGANRLGGVSFGFADPAPLQDEARRQAIADARRAAEVYAAAAGVKLGQVLTIEDFGGSGPVPLGAVARFAAESVPIATGESSITASVRVVWHLAQ